MSKEPWIEELKKSKNNNVLLMLSGGKDSSACLHKLVYNNISVIAIHFTHKWNHIISTNEARRLCKEMNVELIEIDITEEFLNAVKGYRGGRPCLLCKPKMYDKVLEEIKGKYGWICIGDNADDRTTIVRINDYIKNKTNESLYCNTYFGNERGIILPKKVNVLRPLLDLNSAQVEEYLMLNKIEIKKNNSTGDKYFEYSREGCPIQFHDPGYEIKEETMDDLKKYNLLICEFAKENNIRASIHLPSTFIITVPKGYEIEAGKYLEEHGLIIDWEINSVKKLIRKRKIITLYKMKSRIFKKDTAEILFERMFERLEMKLIGKKIYCEFEHGLNYFYELKNCSVRCSYINHLEILTIDFTSEDLIDDSKIENLIIEIFRTRNYEIAN